MNSWKTTSAGILMLVTLIAGAVSEYLQHGTLPNLPLLLPQIMAAIGLIAAKDGNVSNSPHPMPRPEVVAPVLIVALACVLTLSGCATDPRTGRKIYVGPSLTVGASYEGVSGTIHLDPSFAKQKK